MNPFTQTVELSFAFPFFGRTISKLIVTSAGAVILGNLDEPIPCPSHIAPLLSSLPPGNDTCDFAEAGGKTHFQAFVNYEVYLQISSWTGSFTVQWKKHFLHMRESFELTIYEDGSMVFIYHNLIAPLLKKAKDSGYPVLIGLQDSFAVQDKSQGKHLTSHTFGCKIWKVLSSSWDLYVQRSSHRSWKIDIQLDNGDGWAGFLWLQHHGSLGTSM